jgi:hypothetical protein
MTAPPVTSSVPVIKPNKPPRLRDVRFEDHPQVVALAAKFALKIEPLERWKDLWLANPAYLETGSKTPKGWVLETPEGSIVGYLGNIPLNYELDGKKLRVATTRAWVVDAPYRSYSPLLLASHFGQRDMDLFLSTSINEQSAPAYSSFQTIRVPVGEWDRALFWITNYPGFAASFLRRKGVSAANVLGYPVGSGIQVLDLIKHRRLRTGDTRIQCLAAFDDRFDEFWDTLRRKKSHVVLGVRNRKVLSWHFDFNLQRNRAWIYAAEAGTALAAYSIFLRYDFPRIGLTRMRLVDFQCPEPSRSADLLLGMLATAMERCRRESIQVLEVVGLPTQFEEKIVQAGSPHYRKLTSWLYSYKPNDPHLAQRLKDSTVWEPWLFDGDSSF